MTPAIVCGLDLSLRQTAAVALPVTWAGDWSLVRSMTIGRSLKKTAPEHDRIERLRYIAAGALAFCAREGVTHAFVESYGYSRAEMAHSLGELGGVVRVELRAAGIEVATAPMASVRKLLLGKVPKADPKVHVFTALRAAGAVLETTDEADACAVALWGVSELGGLAVAA